MNLPVPRYVATLTSRSPSCHRSCWSAAALRASTGTGDRCCEEWRCDRAPLLTWHIKSTTTRSRALLRIIYAGQEAGSRSLFRLQPARRFRFSTFRTTSGRNCGSLHTAELTPGAVDRRDRPGRHRISPMTFCSSSIAWISRLRNAARHQCDARPICDDHSNNEKESAGRVPAPLLLPLHIKFPRPTTHEPDRRTMHFPASRRPGRRACGLFRGARVAGPEEEANRPRLSLL